MLVDQAQVKPGDNVLVWGAAGGLGIFAVQLCKLLGANAIAVVSSTTRATWCSELGATAVINRNATSPGVERTPERRRSALDEIKRFGEEIREAHRRQGLRHRLRARRLGDLPDLGLRLQALRQDRHLRRDQSGYNLDFDVRYLWMRQKQILGSHFANAYQAERANQLIIEGKIQPVLDRGCSRSRSARSRTR